MRRRVRSLALVGTIIALQFVAFEAGLRTWTSSEAGPSFQSLFQSDPLIGHRLNPHARIRFRTAEFDAEIAINGAGVRDDEELGPKAPDERRIVLLGDSLVLAVQVPFQQTFGELLEADLNRRSSGVRYRVINAGVQGYGPIEELLLFRLLGQRLQPDLVVACLYAGNDAEEAFGSRWKLQPRAAADHRAAADSWLVRLRRLVRQSMVLQIVRLRLVMATERLEMFKPPEPPLQSYAVDPAPRIAEGMAATAGAVEAIARHAAELGAATAVVLLPARLQVDDADYERYVEIVRDAGGAFERDAATERLHRALAGLPVPRFDALPAFRRAQPGPDVFFQTTAHLTPHGHQVLAEALSEFLRASGLAGPGAPRP